MNCHFVTRRLTRKWEIRPGIVRYLDFEKASLEEGQTKTLLAIEGLNTPDVERRLNELVEKPLVRFIDRFAAKGTDSVDDWKMYRATHLYFMLQIGRIAKARPDDMDPRIAEDFEDLIQRPEEYIDQLSSAMMHTNSTMLLRSKWPMCFPSDGFFGVPVDDAVCITGKSLGYVVPVDPHIAIGWVPSTISPDFEWSEFLLHIMSVGLRSKLAVIPPLPSSDPKTDEVVAEVLDLRRRAKEILKLHARNRQLAIEIFEAAGLSVKPVDSFRDLENE